MSILFKNIGLIDPDSITTFGVCAKESDNPIGYFGTGLKYAIAVLLRENQEINIYSGPEKYRFGLTHKTIRGKEFAFVTMNNMQLGFTTELGKNWEIWQAFRELYCNCLDEKGISLRGEIGKLHDDETVIEVTGQKFDKIFDERSSIILEKQTPLHKSAFADIYDKQNDYMFYRGIRCFKLPKTSKYTYNIISDMELTEDRTFASPHFAYYHAAKSILTAPGRIVSNVIAVDKAYIESHFDYNWDTVTSDEFLQTVGKLLKTSQAILNNTALQQYKKHVKDEIKPELYQPNDIETAKINDAINFLKKNSYPIDNYPICIVESLGKGVLAQALDGKIYLTREVILLGDNTIKHALLEEYLHLRHGFFDESRELQTFLFQSLIQALEQIA